MRFGPSLRKCLVSPHTLGVMQCIDLVTSSSSRDNVLRFGCTPTRNVSILYYTILYYTCTSISNTIEYECVPRPHDVDVEVLGAQKLDTPLHHIRHTLYSHKEKVPQVLPQFVLSSTHTTINDVSR